MELPNFYKSYKRKCDGCTACCEGWLEGEAYGKKFYPGKPCHFMGTGKCTIYAQRPEHPCKQFSCVWLLNNEMPEWMKPDRSGIILILQTWTGGTYIKAIEAGKIMDAAFLSWLVIWSLDTNTPIMYQINGGWNYIGSRPFITEMDEKFTTSSAAEVTLDSKGGSESKWKELS